jgi:hypothetical protein
MPRRKPPRRGNKQHSKGKKRPRGWHRRKKLPLNKLLREIKRTHPKPAEEET